MWGRYCFVERITAGEVMVKTVEKVSEERTLPALEWRVNISCYSIPLPQSMRLG